MSPEFVAECKAFLCGALTFVTAFAIVRDLVVGVSGFSGVYPFGIGSGSGRGVGLRADNAQRYARADNPIGYGFMIIQKIAILIFCGAQTLHFIGVIADDPILTLMHAVQQLLAR